MNVLLLHLAAPNDVNGNPRRVYVGIDADSGAYIGVQDEGYSGGNTQELRRTFGPNIIGGPRIEISATEYRRWLRIGRTIAEEGERVRFATVPKTCADLSTVSAYLPGNYSAQDNGDTWLIFGVDRAGWTLDGYVIPRLASGLIFAEEAIPHPDDIVAWGTLL